MDLVEISSGEEEAEHGERAEILVHKRINHRNLDVTRADMDHLRPRQWLNDVIINTFFVLIGERNARERAEGVSVPRIVCLTTMLYDKMMQHGANRYNYAKVKRWMARSNINLFSFDRIFIPVNKGGFHWNLVVVYNDLKRIKVFDSFLDPCFPIMRNVLRYLEDEWNRLNMSDPFPQYTMGPQPGDDMISQQDNGYDCGVFTCMFGDLLSELLPLPPVVNAPEILAYRRKIAVSILEDRLPTSPAVYARQSAVARTAIARTEAELSFKRQQLDAAVQRRQQAEQLMAQLRDMGIQGVPPPPSPSIARSPGVSGVGDVGGTGYAAALAALQELEREEEQEEENRKARTRSAQGLLSLSQQPSREEVDLLLRLDSSRGEDESGVDEEREENLAAFLGELEGEGERGERSRSRSAGRDDRSFGFRVDPNFDPLGNPALGLLRDVSRVDEDDIMRQLVETTKHRRNVFVNLPGSGLAEGARSICSVYSSEGYDCMIQDKNRNNAYEQGIAVTPAKQWLEIGPGQALTLTQLVWRKHKSARVVGVEVNPQSAKLALRQARDKGWMRQFKLIQGYSTSPDVQQALKQEEPFGAVLQEILGVIASSEGVVPVIGNLRATLSKSKPVFVPRYFGTFFALTHVDVQDLASAERAAHVNIEERTVMTQHLNFDHVDPLRLSKTAWPSFMGILEFVDLATIKPLHNPHEDQTEYEMQEHVHEFTSREEARVNSISTFVWAGFAGSPADASRRGGAKTLFPYGLSELRSAAGNIGASFSTFSEDAARSTAWKNLVVILKMPLTLGPNRSVRVTATSFCGAVQNGEPKAVYRFVVEHVVDGAVISREAYNITNLYPSFEPLTRVDMEEIEERLPHRIPFEVGLTGWRDPTRSPLLSFSRSPGRSPPRSPMPPMSPFSPPFSPSPRRSAEEREMDALIASQEEVRHEKEETQRRARDAALLHQYEDMEARMQRSAERRAQQYEDMLEQKRLVKMQARIIAEKNAARDEALAAEVDQYEAQQEQEAQQQQDAAQAFGAAYGVGCTRRRKTECPDKEGCAWFVGKGCKPETFVPGAPAAPRGTGCSKSPKYLCDQNQQCKWVKYKGCRVDRALGPVGSLGGGGGAAPGLTRLF